MVSLGNGVAVTSTVCNVGASLDAGDVCADTPDARPSKSVAQGAH